MSQEITSTITRKLAVLSENGKGYTKEVNLVSWNGADAKRDIRVWFPDHEKCCKVIVVTEGRGRRLMQALVGPDGELDHDV